MKQILARAAVCAVIASTLAGCAIPLAGLGPVLVAGGIGAPVLAQVGKRHRFHGAERDYVPGHSIEYMMRADVTCEKKRDEWLVVYQSSRRLPPQLRCGPNGAFGSPRVYGRAPDRIAVEPAEQPPSLAQEDP
jgi:hypothetical protein